MRYCDFINDYKKNEEDYFPLNYTELIYLIYFDINKVIKTMFYIY